MEVINKSLTKPYDILIRIAILLVFLFCVFLLYLLAKKPKEVIKNVPIKIMTTPTITPTLSPLFVPRSDPTSQAGQSATLVPLVPQQIQNQEIKVEDGQSQQSQTQSPSPTPVPQPTIICFPLVGCL